MRFGDFVDVSEHDQNHAKALEALRDASGKSFVVCVETHDGDGKSDGLSLIAGVDFRQRPLTFLVAVNLALAELLGELWSHVDENPDEEDDDE